MSQPIGKIRCHGCSFEGAIARRQITLRYSLPDGTIVYGYRATGWCSTCECIRDVESPLDVPELRIELAATQPQRGVASFFVRAVDRALGGTEPEDQGERRRLEALIHLAEQRRSPPRCLTCGQTAITLLVFEDTGTCSQFTHSCGGHLYQLPTDPKAPRFSYKPEEIPLDSEGNRLDRKVDHFDDLLAFLVIEWEFKRHYAEAFLNAYRSSISKLHEEGLGRLEKSVDLSDPANRLLRYRTPDPRSFAVVTQAYIAFVNDLQHGSHKDTPVELAIFAVLITGADLLKDLNPSLASRFTSDNPLDFKFVFPVFNDGSSDA
jgi:hypothetical protein